MVFNGKDETISVLGAYISDSNSFNSPIMSDKQWEHKTKKKIHKDYALRDIESYYAKKRFLVRTESKKHFVQNTSTNYQAKLKEFTNHAKHVADAKNLNDQIGQYKDKNFEGRINGGLVYNELIISPPEHPKTALSAVFYYDNSYLENKADEICANIPTPEMCIVQKFATKNNLPIILINRAGNICLMPSPKPHIEPKNIYNDHMNYWGNQWSDIQYNLQYMADEDLTHQYGYNREGILEWVKPIIEHRMNNAQKLDEARQNILSLIDSAINGYQQTQNLVSQSENDIENQAILWGQHYEAITSFINQWSEYLHISPKQFIALSFYLYQIDSYSNDESINKVEQSYMNLFPDPEKDTDTSSPSKSEKDTADTSSPSKFTDFSPQ